MAHKQGRIATWDAANAISARIAEKLGYHMLETYTVHEVTHEAGNL